MKKSVLPQLFLKEVHTDGFLVVLGEYTPAIPLDHARLPDCTISNDDYLENSKMRIKSTVQKPHHIKLLQHTIFSNQNNFDY